MRKMIPAFVILLIMITCSEQTEDRSRIQDLLFEANPALLGEQVELSGMRLMMHPPKNWAVVDSVVFNQVQAQLESGNSDAAPVRILPVRIFLNMDNQSMLSISKIVSEGDSISITKALDYIEKNNPVDQGERKVTRAKFIKDDILFEQLLVQDQLRVTFTLLFEDGNGHPVQCDYSTLKTVYPQEIKAIESSIGSIYLNHEKGGRHD